MKNLFHKTEKTVNHNTKLERKVKRGFRFYAVTVLSMSLVLGMAVTAHAASDPITVVNNLSDFIFGLIRAVGLILLGWGIVQVGLSLQSHDPSQRSNGFLTLAGGVVITFAKEILTLITRLIVITPKTPDRTQQSGSVRERRHSGMSELLALAGSEGYEACADEKGGRNIE